LNWRKCTWDLREDDDDDEIVIERRRRKNVWIGCDPFLFSLYIFEMQQVQRERERVAAREWIKMVMTRWETERRNQKYETDNRKRRLHNCIVFVVN